MKTLSNILLVLAIAYMVAGYAMIAIAAIIIAGYCRLIAKEKGEK